MSIEVVLAYGDGSERPLSKHDQFVDAMSEAVALADAVGDVGAGPDDKPSRVHVRDGRNIALTLRVLRGGLSGDRPIKFN